MQLYVKFLELPNPFTGGFYNESAIRKKELRQSCTTLGIPSGNLIIIEHR